MDKKTRQLDLEFIKDHITVKTYPVSGMDVYEVRIYYKGAYLKSVEVDGIELESWRYKDKPDPDSHTYDELKKDHPETWKKMQRTEIFSDDDEGFKKLECKEAERKEGWD